MSVNSIHCHRAFSEKIGVEFPLLSDFNREVIHAYNVAYEDVSGLEDVAKRAAFVIDQTGTVRYKWVTDDSGQLPDVSATLQAVREL